MATTLTPNLKLRVDSNLTANAKYNLSKIDLLGSTFLVDSTNTLKIRSQTSLVLEPNSADIGGEGTGGTVEIGTSNHQLDELNIYVDEVTFNGTLIVEDIVVSGSLELSNGTHTTTLAPAASGQTEDLTLRFPSNNGTAGSCLSTDGAGNLNWADPTFAVTSVDLTAPADIFSVSGVPITSAGTIALTKVNQEAGKVYAGPETGATAEPTFRPLVLTDLPTITPADIGLGNVDNTSDLDKPISTATQNALDDKYDASNPDGFVDAVGAAAAAPVQSVAGKVGDVLLNSSDVGLGNVPNEDATNPANIDQTSDYRFVTDTEKSIWNTVTDKLDTSGGSMTGELDMGFNSIVALADPVNAQDAAHKQYVDTGLSAKLDTAGGTLTGELYMSFYSVTGLADPLNPQDAAHKQYVDTGLSAKQDSLGTGTITEFLRGDLTWQEIDATTDPTLLDDIEATRLGYKKYLSGTAYNTGIIPTITSSAEGTVIGAELVPYQLQDGSWRLKGNIPQTNLSVFYANIAPGFQSTVSAIAIQSDDSIILGGAFLAFKGNLKGKLVRIAPDGTEDTTFSTNLGIGFSVIGDVATVVIQPSDNKILVGGNFTTFNGVARNRLVRLNTDGTLDTTFSTNLGTGFSSTVSAIAVQSDGKILVGGNFTAFNGNIRAYLVRLNSDGTEDTAFYTNLGTGFNASVETLAIQPDGKILVGGTFQTLNGITRNRFVRLNSDGTVDTAFYTNLGLGFNQIVTTCALQSDGKILVGGNFTGLNAITRNGLVRLNSDGTVDTAFYTNLGAAFATPPGLLSIAVQSDGKILAGGNYTLFNSQFRARLIRLNTDGTEDVAFSTNLGIGFGGGAVSRIAVQSDNKIIVAGGFTTFRDIIKNRLIRLNTDGTEAEITSYTYTISDLTFSSTQSATGSLGLGTATSGTNVITIGPFSSAIGSTLLSKSGCTFDVALTSKPAWAY